MWHPSLAALELEQDSVPEHGPLDQATPQIRACFTTHKVYPAALGS